MSEFQVDTGITGTEQMNSFQNAALSVFNPSFGQYAEMGLAVSVAVRPIIPDEIVEQGEEAVKEWLTKLLKPLASSGLADVEIQMGNDED